jgi:hypothetical protein
MGDGPIGMGSMRGGGGMRGPRVQVSIHAPHDAFRDLPRYGVGTDRISDMTQNSNMMPNAQVRPGRHGSTHDPVTQAMAKMMQDRVQSQFFNRLMPASGF